MLPEIFLMLMHSQNIYKSHTVVCCTAFLQECMYVLNSVQNECNEFCTKLLFKYSQLFNVSICMH